MGVGLGVEDSAIRDGLIVAGAGESEIDAVLCGWIETLLFEFGAGECMEKSAAPLPVGVLDADDEL